MRYLKPLCFAALPALLLASCVRRPLEMEPIPQTARIPVHIDWSQSGLNPTNLTNTASLPEAEQVHRVTLRFYPTDGSPFFDKFMEANVIADTIELPVGEYKIIVFNESVDDTPWWAGAIYFTDDDNYDLFAAHAVPYDPTLWPQAFPFYTAAPGETILGGPDPRRLASWSLGYFDVTTDMVLTSRGRAPINQTAARSGTRTIYDTRLTNIVMRRLTYNVAVTAHVTNLVSILTNYCAVSGFANMVYMASALTTQSPSTKLFQLNGRVYDANRVDGTTTHSFMSFGRTPTPATEDYKVGIDVLYISGVLYVPDPPTWPQLTWDVTDQVVASAVGVDFDININLNYNVEFVAGGIAVDDWNDTYQQIIK